MKPLKMHRYDEIRDAPVCGIDRRYADTTDVPERVTCVRCLAKMEAAR